MGIPVLEKLIGLLVYWCIGFLFVGSFVPKFLGFKVSKVYQLSISRLLGDIDLIFKISRCFNTNLYDFLEPVFSEMFEIVAFLKMGIGKNIIYKNSRRFS